MKKKDELPACPVATTVQLIGSKWKLLILRNLLNRPWRFNELLRSLEGISQKVLTDSLRSMEADAGCTLDSLSVDGGASRNDFIMQFQADILGIPVVQTEAVETTALGAAYLAGLAVGYWEDREEIRQNRDVACRFEPGMDAEERARELAGWHDAVSRARSQR